MSVLRRPRQRRPVPVRGGDAPLGPRGPGGHGGQGVVAGAGQGRGEEAHAAGGRVKARCAAPPSHPLPALSLSLLVFPPPVLTSGPAREGASDGPARQGSPPSCVCFFRSSVVFYRLSSFGHPLPSLFQPPHQASSSHTRTRPPPPPFCPFCKREREREREREVGAPQIKTPQKIAFVCKKEDNKKPA